MKKTFLALLFVMGVSISVAWAQQKESPGMSVSSTEMDLRYELISSADGAWGFGVYDGARLLLYQPLIVLNSSEAILTDKTQAETLARFTMEKIRKGEMPQAVTTEGIPFLLPETEPSKLKMNHE